MDTPGIQAVSHCRYTLAELHQEIIKDEDWRSKFQYLPKVYKTGLKSYSKKKLLVGTYKTIGQGRVYAHAYPHESEFSLVKHISYDDPMVELHRQQKVGDAEFLKSIEYVEPFNWLLLEIGGIEWRKSVRFLVMYYFLEQGTIDYSKFLKDGMEVSKDACNIIARESIRMQIKPSRPLLSLPETDSTAAESQDQLTTQGGERDDKAPSSKQEPLLEMPKTVFENDSTRVTSTIIRQDDKIAAQLLPKSAVSQPEPKAMKESPVSSNEPKRKRLASDVALGEEDPQEDSEFVFGRFKRLVRRKIENLEREEIAVQDTLSAQTMSLTEAQNHVLSLEKTLLVTKVRLDEVKMVKAATERRLNEMRGGVLRNKELERGIDAFHA